MNNLGKVRFTVIHKGGQTHRVPSDRQFYFNVLLQSEFHSRVAVLADRIESLIRERGVRNDFNRQKFYEAAGVCVWAHRDVKRQTSGRPYADHPITVAERDVNILRVTDSEELIACLLHDTVEDTAIDLRFIERRFGRGTAVLVDGVTKITQLGKDKLISEENIDKFVGTLARDIRALRIKMIDRGVNLEDAEKLSAERRERNCREALDFYVPLGVLCGFMKACRHLSDIAFKKLHPDRYNEVEAVIKGTIGKKQELLDSLRREIAAKFRQRFRRQPAEILTKPRTVYEVDQIAAMRGTEARNLSDVVMMQITVETEQDCYALIDVVHSLGIPIDRYWHDYIKDRKINGYQSLHTGILAGDTLIRFQIRTRRMQAVANDGVLVDAYDRGGRYAQPRLPWLNADWLQTIFEVKDRREKIRLTKSLAQAWLATVMVTGPSASAVYRDVLLPRGVTPLEIAFITDPLLGFCLAGAIHDERPHDLREPIRQGVGLIKLLIGGEAQPLDYAQILADPLARRRFMTHQKKSGESSRAKFARQVLEAELAKAFVRLREVEEGDPEKTRWLIEKTGSGEIAAVDAAAEIRSGVRRGGTEIKVIERLELETRGFPQESLINAVRENFPIERYGSERNELKLSIPLRSPAQEQQFANYLGHLRHMAGVKVTNQRQIRPPLLDDLSLNEHSLYYSFDLALEAAVALKGQDGQVLDLNLNPWLIPRLPPEHRNDIDKIVAQHIATARIMFIGGKDRAEVEDFQRALRSLIERRLFGLPLFVVYEKQGMFHAEGIVRPLGQLAGIGVNITEMGHTADFILDCLRQRVGELTAR